MESRQLSFKIRFRYAVLFTDIEIANGIFSSPTFVERSKIPKTFAAPLRNCNVGYPASRSAAPLLD
jgi:hypothetical protein